LVKLTCAHWLIQGLDMCSYKFSSHYEH